MVVHNCPNKRLPFRGVPFMFTIAEKNESAMQLHLPLPPAMDSDFTGMSILGISQGAVGWRLKGPKNGDLLMIFQRKIMGIMVENDGNIIQYNMPS